MTSLYFGKKVGDFAEMAYIFFLEMRKRYVLSQMVVMAFHILAVWKCECASLQGS